VARPSAVAELRAVRQCGPFIRNMADVLNAFIHTKSPALLVPQADLTKSLPPLQAVAPTMPKGKKTEKTLDCWCAGDLAASGI
jgi:hypothetical protein